MDETVLKQQIVRCIRMLERQGIIDYNGHASVRAGEGRMFINIGSCQRSQLDVDDICTIDFDGNLIAGNGKPPLEFHLHAGIYKARPDVQAVVHAHPNWSTILTTAGSPYLPVYAQGSLVHPLPVLDSPELDQQHRYGESANGCARRPPGRAYESARGGDCRQEHRRGFRPHDLYRG